jgi:hypothetical protein
MYEPESSITSFFSQVIGEGFHLKPTIYGLFTLLLDVLTTINLKDIPIGSKDYISNAIPTSWGTDLIL